MRGQPADTACSTLLTQEVGLPVQVRFFERVKIERRLKQLQAKDFAERSAEDKRQLAKLQDDLEVSSELPFYLTEEKFDCSICAS